MSHVRHSNRGPRRRKAPSPYDHAPAAAAEHREPPKSVPHERKAAKPESEALVASWLTPMVKRVIELEQQKQRPIGFLANANPEREASDA